MSSRVPFLELLKKRTVLFDGAMGTTLIANGMTAGECPRPMPRPAPMSCKPTPWGAHG
jgi:methionine synthase I (cobalamin-dependent)